MLKITVYSDIHEISADLANNLTSEIINAVRNSQHIFIALSGGNTPRELYSKINSTLLESDIDVSSYLGITQIDERWVDSSQIRSNQFMIKNTLSLISNLKHYYPIPVSDSFNNIKESANQYETTMRVLIEEFKKIDIGIFGMGSDGHTASLFPFNSILESLENRLVVYGYVDSQNEDRVSITPELMNYISKKIFLITGSTKGQVLKNAIKSNNSEMYPVLLAIDENTLILMDKEAHNEYTK